MSISSINNSSAAMTMRSAAMQRPDPTKLAEDLFSKLDSSGKGYIEKSDLQSAFSKLSSSDSSSGSSAADDFFSKLDGDNDGKVTKEEMSATVEKIAASLDGPFPRMRLQNDSQNGQGGMPPPPPPSGSQGAQNSGDSSNSSQSTDPADTNGDGTVSIQEAMAYQLSKNSSSTNTDAQLVQMLAGDMQPPPMRGDGPSLSKDELTSMSQELSSTDSRRSQALSDLASNFDTADSNGDGKISGSEAKSYEDSKKSSGNDASSATANVSDAQFMKHMMQLLKSYGGFEQTQENNFSASA